MTITWKTRADSPRSAPLGSVRIMGAAVAAMLRALRNRRAVLRISDLPDELLNDIGLRRDDVHDALNTSWREDPSYKLALAASQRRRRL